MELAFDSMLLRSICENETRAALEFGPTVAEVLKHRLADLRAATSVADLVAGNPRVLENSDRRCMVLDLRDGYQLVFCANHPRNPVDETAAVDWQRVSRIKILRIEDNHD